MTGKELTGSALALFLQERNVLGVTEEICRLMEVEGVNRQALSKRLNWSKSRLDGFLQGHHPMTLRDISDVFTALGNRMVVVGMRLTEVDRKRPL